MENEKYLILLYYCYAQIEDPEAYREEHHLFCIENNIRGRIIVSSEGLNGTVSGLEADCQRYMDYVRSDPRFADTEFKIDTHDQHAFAKIHVRAKDEIVHSGLKHLNPREKTGKHLKPLEFKAMKDREDVVILDVRSDYEHKLGHFKNALRLDIENFRDFPEKVKELAHLKDKKILTYCTGGIKCEKASAFLLDQGFEDVYQLHGGIIKYGMEAGGEDFEGKCYVFDNRVAVDVNQVNPTVVSTCYICGTKSDRMVNCANPVCNIHVPICESCGWEYQGACSSECIEHPEKRPYDGTGYYQKNTVGYNPYKGFYRKSDKQATPCQSDANS
ncbi:MAG: rhodanese-related sulfurtransferase [Lunatimonas sp.]|uniref:oxygen-dependent tRNA uridine(34) hydroxylase TrhO n=1 Tax=Lunatimonas sp. TaxID=2060141 RepID=UPI00263B0A3B|nr:rhodanese-related sulfurtransferase [Lunatimonas sp.]MCC5939364.1 rhodanese-related sulfurtransferase [Lunatimonas sp.]